MKYSILLILTDGSIECKKEKRKIISQVLKASELPLSIIIAGIGQSEDDFNFMEVLDADEYPLKERTIDKAKNVNVKVQERDCVKFVSYEQHKDDAE